MPKIFLTNLMTNREYYITGAGDYTVYGLNGDDVIVPGYNMQGNDYFDGGNDSDILGGGHGNDTLIGGAGDDTLMGGVGDDVLMGGPGADVIYYGRRGDWGTYADDFNFGHDTVSLGSEKGNRMYIDSDQTGEITIWDYSASTKNVEIFYNQSGTPLNIAEELAGRGSEFIHAKIDKHGDLDLIVDLNFHIPYIG
jgi:hypothetical protein